MARVSKPILICGQQRSGTTALQSALSHVDSVRNFGEIFQFSDYHINKTPHNFYYYLNNVHGHWKPLISVAQAEEEFRRYLDYLNSLTEATYYVVDIKYNFWHHFAPGWVNNMGRPFMLEFFKKLEAPVVHVVRRNTFRQYVSNEIAARTAKWHFSEGDASPPVEPFDIDVRDLEDHFEMVDGNAALFRKRLRGYPHSVELCYENLFNGTTFTDEANRLLRQVLPGWIVSAAESQFVKSKSQQMEWVRNGEAIIDYFRESSYGVMVIDSLRPPLKSS